MFTDIPAYLTALPAIGAILVSLLAGGFTAMRLLMAAAQVVGTVAQTQLSNEEKRAAAVEMLYKEFPKLGLAIPKSAMGQIVETAWQGLVKPLLAMPLPPAPPKEEKPAEPAK